MMPPTAKILGDDAAEYDGPMTEKQAAQLRHLADAAGEPFDGNLTRRQANERIAHLEEKTGSD